MNTCRGKNCEGEAIACASCAAHLVSVGIKRMWVGYPRAFSEDSCQLCHSPEFDALWCARCFIQVIGRALGMSIEDPKENLSSN